MAWGGAVFDAEAALALGLVDEVVAKGEGLEAALRLSESILARSPDATVLTKMMINIAEGEECRRALDALAGLAAASGNDLQESLKAFCQKRRPRFQGETE